MGRGKLSMELIVKDKARMITYQKRKKGLKKKVQEFSTLCGVPTCMIIYRPELNNHPAETEIWPKEPKKFMEVVNLYREKAATFSVRGIKSHNLFDFFANRQRNLDEKVAKLRKANLEAKFLRGWNDHRLEDCSDVQLKLVLAIIDTQLQGTRRKIIMAKEEQALMEGCESGIFGVCSNGQVLFQKNNMEVLDVTNKQQPISSLKPLDHMQFPPYYPPNELPFDNPVTVMMMNGGDNATSTLPQTMYFDPMALGTPRAMSLYGSTMQPLQVPYEQFPVEPKFSSQMQHAFQFNPELNQFGKRRML